MTEQVIWGKYEKRQRYWVSLADWTAMSFETRGAIEALCDRDGLELSFDLRDPAPHDCQRDGANYHEEMSIGGTPYRRDHQ